MNEEFVRELKAVDWFAACGKPCEIDLPFPIKSVSNAANAITQCSAKASRHAALEARNRLTMFLSAHHRDDYRKWNAVTRTAKQRVVTPLTKRVWQPFADRLGLGDVLVNRVAWDILAAIMEQEYSACADRPEHFLLLLRVYQAGHFPCGWTGTWPAGKLLVW